MKKQLLVRILLSTTLLGLGTSGSSIAKADIQTDTIDEMWGKPTLVYGAGLNDAGVESTNNTFDIKNIDNVNRQVNSGQDFQTYLNQPGVDDNILFSSVLVQKQAKGKGVQVSIKTPANITSVTESQYANAAITAGASDVQIEVASIKKVTGESALVGVYKALSANGVKVEEDRAQAATQELQTVNQIAEEQSENKDFDPAALDLAVAQIKKDLAEYKKDEGSIASTEVAKNIVEKALKENGLEGLLNQEQIQSLVSFAETYQNTSAIDSKEIANQIDKYSKDTYNKLSEGFQKAINSDEARSLFSKVSNFFESLWKDLSNWFSSL